MKLMHVLLAAVLACAICNSNCSMTDRTQGDQQAFARALGSEGRMPSLSHATTWINSEPLTDDALRGKVVLVGFWTYTCINWRRQLPYLREWDAKYRDKGLVVIGVHTPEFGFEKDVENVRRAVGETRVTYPVVLDSDYSIWRAFANHYWPALYFVDAKGNIRHHQFGEGEYEESQRVIQELLKESGSADVSSDVVAVDARGEEAAADWNDLRSPETYLGYDRAESFSSPGGAELNASRRYEFPARLGLNDWALSGEWTFGQEGTRLNSGTGALRMRFHARDVHLILGPSASGSPISFRVLIDGEPPGDSQGVDVDAQGNGTVVTPKMYQLIRQTSPVSDREFEIEFLDPGVEIFAFTFG